MLSTIAEIGYGILFLVGAIFNASYTSTHGDEFYGAVANGAFMPGARRLVEKFVIPNATLFTVLVVVFQTAVATMILLRGDLVQRALLAGAALVAVFASSSAGAFGNLALAVGLLLLAVTR